MKYATAISPARMKAAGRAKRPISEKISTVIPPGIGIGKPKSFVAPTSMKRSAATMRRTLRRRGAQADHLLARVGGIGGLGVSGKIIPGNFVRGDILRLLCPVLLFPLPSAPLPHS